MKTHRAPWQKRLAPSSAYSAKCPKAGAYEDEMTLSFESDTGVEYELDCTVFAEFEPAQRGGRTDPSWDAYFTDPVAYWFRPGHGWKEMTLTERQQEEILEHFKGQGDDGYDGGSCEPYDSYYDR